MAAVFEMFRRQHELDRERDNKREKARVRERAEDLERQEKRDRERDRLLIEIQRETSAGINQHERVHTPHGDREKPLMGG